jgi:integrase
MLPAADTYFTCLLRVSTLLQSRSQGTLGQYRQTLRWYWRVWVIPVGHLPRARSEVQRFLDGQRGGGLPTRHHRALQAMVNRFWVPQLPGSRVTLVTRCAARQQRWSTSPRDYNWTYFVPRYVLADACFEQHKDTLCRYVGLCNPKPADVRNVRYAISILHKWILRGAPSPAEDTAKALIGAIVARVHQAPHAAVDRVIVETTRVANRLLLVRGTTWKLPLAQVRAMYHSSLSCNHLIARNMCATNMEKRCTRLVRRHAFNDDEVCRLISNASTLRDRCVVVMLSHTGMRRRALAWLQLAAVWDGSRVRSDGHTLEKGMCLRTFTIDSDMALCLQKYILHERPWGSQSPWLFPSPHNPTAHIQPGTLQIRLKQHCDRLGIVGSHVRLHGLRKYTVGMLLQVGNSIESVSEWLGHRSVNTTYATYWDTEARDISAHMHIPWLLTM